VSEPDPIALIERFLDLWERQAQAFVADPTLAAPHHPTACGPTTPARRQLHPRTTPTTTI